MSQMLKSSGAMGIATLCSRVLGMVREIVYARFMGDGAVASAFKLAFTLPNLLRRLLGEGALTAAFIPIFKEKEKKEGEKEMWHAANAVISALVVLTASLTGLVVIGISLVLHFRTFDSNTELLLNLIRLVFPYLIFVCLAAMFMGMLNIRGLFFLPALGATMLNVVMIATVFLVTPWFGDRLEEQIFALGFGILFAGIAQAGFQLPSLLHQGFRFRWVTPWNNPTVKEVARKMIPGVMGLAAFHINVLLIQLVAYNVDRNIVASFDYAVRLMELPQGVFGLSLAAFLLPTLSGLAADKNYGAFRDTLRQGLGYLLFLNTLAAILLVILAVPIIRLLYQGGEFTEFSTARVSIALAWLAPGLVAFSFTNILARAFYALGDTLTPMRISVFCLIINLVISLWLIFPYRQAGLGAANSLTGFLNAALLIYGLKRKLTRLDLSPLKSLLWGQAAVAIVSAGTAWFTLRWWQANFGHNSLWERLGEVFVPAILAGLAYCLLALWLRLAPARDIFSLVRDKLK